MVEALVGVKFCGGCNPQINRSRIFKELQRRLPGQVGIIGDQNRELWEVGILLGGCPVACVDSEEIRGKARKWIIVGGTTIDYFPVEEDGIVDAIVEKIGGA